MSTRSTSPSSINENYPSTNKNNNHQCATNDHSQSSGDGIIAGQIDNESDTDEVTQEDELLLEGIIGGPAGVVDVQQHLCTDISMSGPEGSSAAAVG